jgi:hypothetical protein
VKFEQEALNECRCRRGAAPVVRMPARIDLSQGLLRLPASDTAIANSAETGSGAKRRRRPNAGDSFMPEDRNQTEAAAGENAETLTISSEKVCFIIVKAREFDAKDAVTEPDPASNPTDDKETAVLKRPPGRPRPRGAHLFHQFLVGGRADRSRGLGMARAG